MQNSIGIFIGSMMTAAYNIGANLMTQLKFRSEADGGTFENLYGGIDTINDLQSIGLLDTARLIITPNAYKSGVLYGTYPNTTDADMDWVRATTANRTNASLVSASVASGVPRVSYPLDGGRPFVLSEPARTNVCLQSEDMTTTWSSTRLNKTANATTAPDGTTTADKIYDDYSASASHTNQQVNVLVTGQQVISIFVKAGEYTKFYIGNHSIATVSCFDLTTGTVEGNIGSCVGSIEAYPNGWYRVSTVITCTAGNLLIMGMYITYNATYTTIVNHTGDGASGVYIWGCQVEAGAYISTYIPTTTVAVTRAADLGTGSGVAATFNSETGVLFVDIAALYDDSTNRRISISDGTFNNRVVISFDTSNKIQCYYVAGGVSSATPSFVKDTTVFSKIAFRWAVNDFALWVDGTERATDVSGSVCSANTLTAFQLTDGNGGLPFYGKFKAIIHYPVYLDDTQMANLTT